MIYFIALILILFGVFKYDYVQANRGRLLYVILIYVLLVCIAGFRYRLGGDTAVYTNDFHDFPTLDRLRRLDFIKSRYNPGFIIFLSFCRTISDEFYVFQFIVSIIINTAVFLFFYKNTKHFFFGILLYYCFLYIDLNMEVLRQAISISIFLFAWPFLRDGKWLLYYAMMVLAILFHPSALILCLIPLIFLPGIRYFFQFGRRTIIIGIIIFIVGAFLSYRFADLIKFLAITQGITDMADFYKKTGDGGTKVLNITGVIVTLIRLVLYPFIAMYFINKRLDFQLTQYPNLRKIESITVLSLYFAIASTTIIILFRFNNYFLFFPFLIMSDWIFTPFKAKTRKKRLGFATWMVIFLPLFFLQINAYYNFRYNSSGTYVSYMKYYPYNNIFDNEKNPDREKIYRNIRRRGW